MAPRLKEKYQKEVAAALKEQLGLANVNEVPRLEKIVVNMGVGSAVQDAKQLDAAVEDLRVISGQQPTITRAKKSIAGFKIRQGMPIGAKVTLRGDRMWEFLDRLVTIALPRIRDFRGLSPKQRADLCLPIKKGTQRFYEVPSYDVFYDVLTRKDRGFTLIELLIAIAIISVLTVIAVPSYQRYSRKAHYTEVVQAAAPFKIGVEECYQVMGNLNVCRAGEKGVPNNIPHGSGAGLIDSVIVGDKGQITVTPMDLYGITSSDTYTLIPSEVNDQLIWTQSGGGVNKGYVI